MTQALNLEQIRANYLRDLQNQNPAAHVHAGSDNHVRATAIAAVGEGQYQHQEWILRQAFADTADSAYLEKHAAKYGIYRKTATFAGGKVRVRGAVGATVPVGQQINVGDKVYLTAESAVIGALGSAEIAVIATVAGSAQNQTAETAATLQSVPAGIDSSAVLLTMVGGTDAESDESLLARYEERLRRPAAGGNQYDFRNWCLEVPGVVDAFIYPLRRGNGFVDAVILGDRSIVLLNLEGISGSYGATLEKSGQIMLEEGCVTAVALDAGGSSQVWYGDAYACPSSDNGFQTGRAIPSAIEIIADIIETYDTGWIPVATVAGVTAGSDAQGGAAIAYRQTGKQIEMRLDVVAELKTNKEVLITSESIPNRFLNKDYRPARGMASGFGGAPVPWWSGIYISLLPQKDTPYAYGNAVWYSKNCK